MGWPITHPSCIYAIRCRNTGKVYIGRTYRLKSRIKEHFSELRRGLKGSGSKRYGFNSASFQADYDAYGESAFEVYVLQENVPPELCQKAEEHWIREYDSTNPMYGYNIRNEVVKRGSFSTVKGLPPKAWEKSTRVEDVQ